MESEENMSFGDILFYLMTAFGFLAVLAQIASMTIPSKKSETESKIKEGRIYGR